MQIPVFSRAVRTHQVWKVISTVGPILIGLVGMLVLGTFRDQLGTFLSKYLGSASGEVVAALLFGSPVLLAFAFVIPLLRRVDLQLGVQCPNCNKQLAECSHIVIASRNCPFCGNRVLEEP
jgi:hypothetical protein